MARKSKKKRHWAGKAGADSRPAIPVGAAGEKDRRLLLLQVPVMIAAALWIYWPALHGDWLWDDDNLVAHNYDLRDWAGLVKIWTAPPATDYWPLTWTLCWIEWHLWGDRVLGYHMISPALHLAGGFLLWRVLGRLGLRWAWLGALLFVIHPLAVESVAWISEIKNTLSLPLLLLSIDAWLTAEQSGGIGGKSARILSVLWYLAAMLAKTSVIMLPAVLLLYAWWKRGRVTWLDAGRIVPYVIVAAVLGSITVHFQSHTHAAVESAQGFWATFTCAGEIVFFYLAKFLIPVALLPIYPRWTIDPPTMLQLLSVPALVLVVPALWTQRRGWGRPVLFGLGFFLLNLAPVLGFVGMSYMSVSRVADHLVYLPMIGLAALAALGLQAAFDRLAPNLRVPVLVAVAALMAVLAGLSHRHARVFAGPQVFCTYILERNPNCAPAIFGLGLIRASQGDVEGAIAQFEKALALSPHNEAVLANLGHAYFLEGRFDEAARRLEQALEIKPNLSYPRFDLGAIAVTSGHAEQALVELGRFLDVASQDPNADYARLWIWIARAQLGEKTAADAELRSVLASRWHAAAGDWVTQDARFLLGDIPETSYLAAAASADSVTDRNQHGEAWYYIGMKRLLAGDAAGAVAAFRNSAAINAPGLVETTLARVQLKRLAPGT